MRGAYPVAGDDEDGAAGPIDAVIVGFHLDFDYTRLRLASSAVMRGARLIATNDDPTYPTPAGPIPGGGALVAAVATAAGIEQTVAGKPYAPMAATVLDRLDGPDPSRPVMVGDRASTDGRFAVALGAPFALVRSGVTLPGAAVDVQCAYDGADLATVTDQILSIR